MFQNKGIVRRSVEVGDDLDVIPLAVVGQFLKLPSAERVRLDERGRAPVLEVPLQLDGESIDLEKRGLADRPLQLAQPLKMVRVVPIDDAELPTP